MRDHSEGLFRVFSAGALLLHFPSPPRRQCYALHLSSLFSLTKGGNVNWIQDYFARTNECESDMMPVLSFSLPFFLLFHRTSLSPHPQTKSNQKPNNTHSLKCHIRVQSMVRPPHHNHHLQHCPSYPSSASSWCSLSRILMLMPLMGTVEKNWYGLQMPGPAEDI